MRGMRYMYEEPAYAPDDPIGAVLWQAKGMVMVWLRKPSTNAQWDLAGADHTQIGYRVVTRFRSDIKPGGRFTLRDRHLYIRSVQDPDGRGRRLICECLESVLVVQPTVTSGGC